MEKFYITTPIYYSNAEPHIGHSYPTIAADVLARYHRLKGEEVYFLTGLDEHGAKIAEAAQKAGKELQEFCDEIAAKYQFVWDELDISNDDFIRTTSIRHRDGVNKLLVQLKEVGAIYEGEYEGYYCQGCEAFVTEKELVDGLCPIHKKKPQFIHEKNYFFNLKKYLPEIEKAIDDGSLKVIPQIRRKEVLGLFKQDIPDFSISRQSLKWGIPLPWDQNQVAYVWVDALMNYVTALGYGSAEDINFRKFWPAELHLVGKEIIKFHCIFWPAILFAVGLPMPKNIFAHGWFTVDGQKMGKSIGNIIDPHDLIKEFGTDATRYLLLSQFPFGQDGDIKLGNFSIQYNSDLANGIGNLVSRVAAMSEKYFEGSVPAKNDELKLDVSKIWQRYDSAMESFNVYDAISAIKELNALADGYVEKNKPWQLAKSDNVALAKVIYNLLEVIRNLGIMLYPIMPDTATKILISLGQEDFTNYSINDLKEWGRLMPKTVIKKNEALFPRLNIN
ncbi:MAG: methionine--tRNA ligase [Candidatus Buchananbacteria bacterium]